MHQFSPARQGQGHSNKNDVKLIRFASGPRMILTRPKTLVDQAATILSSD